MKAKRGFSMLEIVIACCILSFGFLPIYELFSHGKETAVHNINENIATNYASDIVNFCKDLKYFQINDIEKDKDEIILDDDAKIKEFFENVKFNGIKCKAPPAVEAPFARSMKLFKHDKRKLSELIDDLINDRKKVPSYLVEVNVSYPRNSGRGTESVVLYTLIMD